jgi:hypothetical protein
MNYSNGFDVDTVLPALQKRLGWRQPTVAGSPVLSGDNTASASGRYFQDFHAAATIANIKAAQEDEQIGDTDFNAYLLNLQTSGIMRSLNEIFREPELIEQVLMYDRYGIMDTVVPNGDMAVGYMIDVAPDKGISTQIKAADFYFDSDCSFTVYLFQDGKKTPLKQCTVNVTAWERTRWEFDGSDTNHPLLLLPYTQGKKYYLCYKQSEITNGGQAIREQINNYATTRCFSATTFLAPETSDGFGFNHNYRQYGFLPQGINLEVISFKDHTQNILRKANLFDEVQGLQMAAMVIEMQQFSTRSNFTERQNKQNAGNLYMDLNQAFPTKEVPVSSGLKARIAGELKRLKDTFFPKAQPISTSMQADPMELSGEREWFNENVRVFTNPPIQKIP